MFTHTGANLEPHGIRPSAGFLRVLGVAFDVALSALESRVALDAKATARCRSLREALFARALTRDTSGARATSSLGWDWDELVSDETLCAGVLTVYRGKPIPIHDHPGSCGVLLVVDGVMGVREFRRADTTDSGASTTALRLVGQKRFAPAQHALITRGARNLHSVIAHSEACVVLDLLFSPYRESKRTWYMPLDSRYDDTSPFPVISFDPTGRQGRRLASGASVAPRAPSTTN
ncbi:MAG: hypothetical protein JSW10_04370 [Pseudomonadota bacterium]|nr:MAG: hypothetical protein JSW10_04370 [Pseudomonadota bacterium]